MKVFLCGPLAHPPLLKAVLGRMPAVLEPASLAGFRLIAGAAAALPWPVAAGGQAIGGVITELADPDAIARLNFYLYPRTARSVMVDGPAGPVAALLWGGADEGEGAVWDAAVWTDRWAATEVAAATDLMRRYGATPPDAPARRRAQRLTRAGAFVRAQNVMPTSLRRTAQAGDVVVARWHEPYANYFAVEEFDLAFRRYDGTMSVLVNRAVFVSGDAAIVLPYDPDRDRVMVIEQFRVGPLGRGDPQPWLVEAIAGRIDGGETPEEAARREAREEAGLVLRDLHPAGSYYPSPAAKAEYLYSFIGLADLPDTAAGSGGLASEAEDIRTHVIPYADLAAMVASGEVDNAPLLILAQWLALNRDRLRSTGDGDRDSGQGA